MPTKHYYVFNAEKKVAALDKEAWDSLRTGSDNPAFQFEKSIAEYEANCARREDCLEVAEAIRDILFSIDKEVSCVVSLGAGKGIVEWHLKRLAPELRLVCTDYAEAGVDKLRKMFQRCDQVVPFDMLRGDYGAFGKDAVLLMNRISTEFTPSEWLQIFRSCRGAGIKYIVFIPTEMASFRLKTMETLRHLIRKFLRRHDTFCGWLYSRRELEFLMNLYYKAEQQAMIGSSVLYKLCRKD